MDDKNKDDKSKRKPRSNESSVNTSVKFIDINSTENTQGLATQGAGASPDDLCPPALKERGYTITSLIGGGAFSKVYRAKYRPMGDKEIAVKIISLDQVPEAWKEKCMRTELKIIKKLQHPHIVKVWDIIKTRRSVFIFMDLAENDSVMAFMKSKERPCTEGEARMWFSQTTGAISYMHNRGIAHRDMKNENILLDRDFNAKLTDFGFACFTYDKDTRAQIFSPTTCGTMAYIAPEVLNPPYDAKASDIWSLGVCLFEMLTFQKPFDESLTGRRLLNAQLNRKWKLPIEIESKLKESVKDLMRKLMEPDVENRLVATAILKHPWLLGK